MNLKVSLWGETADALTTEAVPTLSLGSQDQPPATDLCSPGLFALRYSPLLLRGAPKAPLTMSAMAPSTHSPVHTWRAYSPGQAHHLVANTHAATSIDKHRGWKHRHLGKEKHFLQKQQAEDKKAGVGGRASAAQPVWSDGYWGGA